MELRNQLPISIPLDFDILWPEALENQWRFLMAIQEAEPVFWSEHQRAWLITRHADVRAAHRDARLSSERMEIYLRDFSDAHKRMYPVAIKYASLLFSYLDGATHSRQRNLVLKALNRPSVELMRHVTREISDELLTVIEERGELDFMTDVAYQLPSRVVMRVMGVPHEHRDVSFRMAVALGRAMGSPRPLPGVWDEFEDALKAFLEVIEDELRKIENSPREDLLSALVAARDGTQRLSHDELLATVIALVSAGFDTTGCGLGAFLDWVSSRPELQRAVRESAEMSLKVVEELLRYPGIVRSQTRIVKEDFEWCGKTLKKGDFVYMMHAAANVDPRVFDRPLEVDFTRPSGMSIPFGHGAHQCVGQLLARMEISEFLHRAFGRFDIEVVGGQREFVPMYAFYCYKSLKVRVSRRLTGDASGALKIAAT